MYNKRKEKKPTNKQKQKTKKKKKDRKKVCLTKKPQCHTILKLKTKNEQMNK